MIIGLVLMILIVSRPQGILGKKRRIIFRKIATKNPLEKRGGKYFYLCRKKT